MLRKLPTPNLDQLAKRGIRFTPISQLRSLLPDPRRFNDRVVSASIRSGTHVARAQKTCTRISGQAEQEWLNFLRVIHQVTPADKELHLIADNYATHKHAKVQRWLKRHPRFHLYFTPTSASWLNMVERFFRDLTENRLRRGVFHDVEELIMAVEGYIDRHNENPKPFIWTAKANDILEKVKRARQSLNNAQSV